MDRSRLSRECLQRPDIKNERNCRVIGGDWGVPAPPPPFARTAQWGALVGTHRQVASGWFAAAGFFVSCHSLCRQQVLAGALADDPAPRLVRQSIAGSIQCASAVLLCCDFSCRARNTFASFATVRFGCYLFNWALCGG